MTKKENGKRDDSNIKGLYHCLCWFRPTSIPNGMDLTWDPSRRKSANVTSLRSNCGLANP